MNILLVEDDRKLARALTAMFEEDGHAIDIAHDGERGLEFAGHNQYDAIVLDRMLPRMDGLKVCRQLREDRVETPIIMLTARTAIDDRVEGLDAGADDYLPKPFAFNELIARLRALSRRQIDSRPADRLEVSGLMLDLRRRRAEYSGKAIDLSPTEFSLLETLMRNSGRVLSQAQILDYVWGYDSWPESNLVAVYVTYLRRKFRKLGIPLEIKTVRGAGYILGA